MQNALDSTLTQRIRARAYEMWAANGYPDGNADQHWLSAEREIIGEAAANAPVPRAARKISGTANRAAPRSAKKQVRLAG